MKKYAILVALIATVCIANAQAFNPYQFYKDHEDTQGLWFETKFDTAIKNYDRLVTVAPLKTFKVRTYEPNVLASSIVPFFKDKALSTLHALSLIQTFIEKGRTRSGEKLIKRNLFIINESGKIYGIYVHHQSPYDNTWVIRTIDVNDLSFFSDPGKLKAGFKIISAE